MPLTISICDDNENQIKELRRLLDDWSADKPFALAIDDFHDGHIQGRFYRRPLVLPYREGDTLVSELPDRHTGIVLVPLFME